jgi:hypothetical protein
MTNPKHPVFALVALAAALVMYGVGPTDGASGPPGEAIPLAHISRSGGAAPRCAPSRLNRSAVLPGTGLAVSPLPDTYAASASTQISFLGRPGTKVGGVRVRGARTGSHAGGLRAYSQGDGASFVPSRPFVPGEAVFVRGNVRNGSHTARFTYRFVVARQDTGLAMPAEASNVSRNYNAMTHFLSRPDLLAPAIVVTARSPLAAPGYIFANPYNGPGPSGPMIFDEAGNLVWFNRMPRGTETTNLQVLQYNGKPVLAWWQGHVTAQGFGQGEEVIADSSYRQVGRVHAGNGYKADLHDFHITNRGTAVLTVLAPIRCNLSYVGGPRDGAVTDSIFEELDLRTGLVRREWHSLDHVAVADSYSRANTTSVGWPFDYFHVNSVEQQENGTTLISARNTWALYELSTTGGQVLSTIGGRHSNVRLSASARTAFQHDATPLPGGAISVFDNGAVPKVHLQSRGLVLALNPGSRTATVLAQYAHPKPLLAASQGNMQPLANRDVFIGWGSQPYFSEFSAGGQLLFDAHMHGSYQSYRGYRFAWTGAPAEAPAIAALGPGGRPAVANAPCTVYASWNGDTRTASWRVLGGPSASQLAPVGGAPRSGFETSASVPGGVAYVAVQALDASGAVLGTSGVLRLG